MVHKGDRASNGPGPVEGVEAVKQEMSTGEYQLRGHQAASADNGSLHAIVHEASYYCADTAFRVSDGMVLLINCSLLLTFIFVPLLI